MAKTLFWVDLEMTGLDEKVDKILEIAIVITDINLRVLDTYHKVIRQTRETLDQMNDWCKKTHRDSGLSAAVLQGENLESVEVEIMKLIDQHFNLNDRIVIVGNSVYNDRRFIDKYLPKIAPRLHYRMIDVSSFKEIFKEKYGISFQKKNAHRAVDDIHESVRELSLYLSFVTAPVK